MPPGIPMIIPSEIYPWVQKGNNSGASTINLLGTLSPTQLLQQYQELFSKFMQEFYQGSFRSSLWNTFVSSMRIPFKSLIGNSSWPSIRCSFNNFNGNSSMYSFRRKTPNFSRKALKSDPTPPEVSSGIRLGVP